MKNYVVGTAVLLALGAAVPHSVVADCLEMSTEDRAKKLDKMASDLKLTAEQKAQVQSIKDEKWAKIDAAESEAHTKIRALLNPEQQAKFDKMMEKKMEKKMQ